jgi:hypothetical protein
MVIPAEDKSSRDLFRMPDSQRQALMPHAISRVIIPFPIPAKSHKVNRVDRGGRGFEVAQFCDDSLSNATDRNPNAPRGMRGVVVDCEYIPASRSTGVAYAVAQRFETSADQIFAAIALLARAAHASAAITSAALRLTGTALPICLVTASLVPAKM